MSLPVTIISVGVGLWGRILGRHGLFAKRLAPGLLRDVAEFLPACDHRTPTAP